MTIAIWRIYARLKIPLYPKFAEEKADHDRREATSIICRGEHVSVMYEIILNEN